MAIAKRRRSASSFETNDSSAAPALNLLGASVRAAAISALRAGFAPHACDLFGDVDLRGSAVFHGRVSPYPQGFLEILRRMPRAPFLFTGGLENHPDLIDRLAAIRPLWGNSGATLRLSRDPLAVAQAMLAAGASPPETRSGVEPPANPRGWLLKPMRGAGGRGIRTASSARTRGAPPSEDVYFQRRSRGASCSAVYVASRNRCDWIGATRQLIGERWLHASPHAWCGNVGPLRLPGHVERTLEACGEQASRQLGLLGIFGIDFLLDGDVVRPVEINPRYPASAEILELAQGISTLAIHAQAFGARIACPRNRGSEGPVLGKAVIFAPRTIRAGELAWTQRDAARLELPDVADVPSPGAVVRRAHPVCTVFARAEDETTCVTALKVAARKALRRIAR